MSDNPDRQSDNSSNTYAFAHREVPFAKVGERYGVQRETVSPDRQEGGAGTEEAGAQATGKIDYGGVR